MPHGKSSPTEASTRSKFHRLYNLKPLLIGVEPPKAEDPIGPSSECPLLSRQFDGAVVQFGMMRIWLADLPAAAKEEIASKKSPLGRVLIEHNVLREVELITLWQIEPGSARGLPL